VSVEAYNLLPRRLAQMFGSVLPWLELAIATSLLSGILVGGGTALSFTLLLVFSLAQSIVLLRGQEVPCGCFGSLSTRPVRWANVLSNLGLAACCLATAWCIPHLFGLEWLGLAFLSHEGVYQSPLEVLFFQLAVGTIFVQALIFKQAFVNRRLRLAYERYLRQVATATAIQRVRDKILNAEAIFR